MFDSFVTFTGEYECNHGVLMLVNYQYKIEYEEMYFFWKHIMSVCHISIIYMHIQYAYMFNACAE